MQGLLRQGGDHQAESATLGIVEFGALMPGGASLFTVLCAIAVRRPSVKAKRNTARPMCHSRPGKGPAGLAAFQTHSAASRRTSPAR